MKQRYGVLVIMLFLMLLVTVPAQAESTQQSSFWERWLGSEKAIEKPLVNVRADDVSNRYFSSAERSRVIEYYRQKNEANQNHKGSKNKQKQLPPGLQKKLARGGQLPPGWQRKVARGEVLTADILNNSERIPRELEHQLPSVRDGEVIRRVGDKVVRVLEGNGTVIDVIDLADIFLR